MSWLTEPFSQEFLREALLAGVLAAVTCSLVGTWVVVRGLSFMGEALGHGVLPGIALAFALGVDLLLGAALSAVVMVAGVSLVRSRTRVGDDAAIGLLFVGMLALAVIIMSRSDSYAGDLTGFLFGNILAVDGGDLRTQLVAALVVVLVIVVGYRAFLVLSFHEGKAAVLGLHPGLTHLVLLGLVTAAVVASFRAIGTLLVVALLVAPPATAGLLARRLPTQMVLAALLGSVAVVAGLLLSYHADTAAGASVAASAVAGFFAVLLVQEVLAAAGRLQRRHHTSSARS
jgi:ABC-type Mn2+/Zn2+ transport system permease subunit